MRDYGLPVSAAVHVVLLGALLFAFPAAKPLDSAPAVPVDMVTPEQYDQIMKGDPTPSASGGGGQEAPQQAQATPTPPTRDVPDAEVADTSDDAPPPLPTPKPDPKPDTQALAKLAQAAAAAEAAAKAQEQAKAEAAAKAAQAKADAAAKAAQAKAAADAAAKAQAQARAELAAKAEAAAKEAAEAERQQKLAEAAEAAKKAEADKQRKVAEAEAAKKAEAEKQRKIAEAEAAKKAEAEKQRKLAEAEAAKKAEAEKQKQLADAKAKADAERQAAIDKAVADKKAEAAKQAAAAKNAKALDGVAGLLEKRKAKEGQQVASNGPATTPSKPSGRAGNTRDNVNQTGTTGRQDANAPRLSLSEQAAMGRMVEKQVTRCMPPNFGVNAGSAFAKVKLSMNSDGTLAAAPSLVNSSDAATGNALIRAIKRCITADNPLPFNPQTYAAWKEFNYTHEPGGF